MKLKEEFITYQSGDEQVMVSVDSGVFSGLVRSNRTAAFLIEQLKKETTIDEIVKAVLERYDGVTKEMAKKDVEKIVDVLRTVGAIDE